MFSLTFSGIANAAMVCCWDMGGPSDHISERSNDIQTDIQTVPSCHEALFAETSKSMDANGQPAEPSKTDTPSNGCDCETACYKSTYLPHVQTNALLPSQSSLPPYLEHVLSVPYYTIEHPPKHIL